jgi:hypothetical protein
MLALDALLLVAIIVAAQVHRAAIQTIGRDAAPSIIAAQHIKSALAAMDADAAAGLLRPVAAETDPAAFEKRRVEASEALIAATENITYGNAERDPIRTMQLGMGSYEQQIQHARDLHETSLPGAVTAYRQAATEMDATLLPAAEALDHANNSVLERTYAGEATRSSATRLFVILAGALAAFALIGIQIYLSQKFRRTLNPMLLAATLLLLALVAFTTASLTIGQEQMQVADEDAFASIHTLWRAQAAANQAQSEEDRMLFDPASATTSRRAFLDLADAIVKPPANISPELLLKLVHTGTPVDGLQGYLAQAVNQGHLPGQRGKIEDVLADWEQVLARDAQVRRLEQAGQHRQAIELDLGEETAAFARLDQALDGTLAIEQAAFDASVAKSFSALRGMEIEAALATALIAALIFWGFAARIREYS